jgi:hypothetical protein
MPVGGCVRVDPDPRIGEPVHGGLMDDVVRRSIEMRVVAVRTPSLSQRPRGGTA